MVSEQGSKTEILMGRQFNCRPIKKNVAIKKAAGRGTSGFVACLSLLLARGIRRAAGCGRDAAVF